MTILVIEDDERDGLLLVQALRKAGCAPLPILDRAEEAVLYLEGMGGYSDRARHPLPSLIVLDLSLPGMSGLEFLAWTQSQPRFSGIPIIVLSGSPYAPTVKEAYTLGAKTFFTKPLDSARLDELAHSIVRYWSASASPEGARALENGRIQESGTTDGVAPPNGSAAPVRPV